MSSILGKDAQLPKVSKQRMQRNKRRGLGVVSTSWLFMTQIRRELSSLGVGTEVDDDIF
jgi:hypothetical protein